MHSAVTCQHTNLNSPSFTLRKTKILPYVLRQTLHSFTICTPLSCWESPNVRWTLISQWWQQHQIPNYASISGYLCVPHPLWITIIALSRNKFASVLITIDIFRQQSALQRNSGRRNSRESGLDVIRTGFSSFYQWMNALRPASGHFSRINTHVITFIAPELRCKGLTLLH